jgi:hypothetical protein
MRFCVFDEFSHRDSVAESPPSNIELGSMYLRIIARSQFLPQSLFDEIGLFSLLEESVDYLERTAWQRDPPPALSMLKDLKAYILALPYDSNYSRVRFSLSTITTLHDPGILASSTAFEVLVTSAWFVMYSAHEHAF